MASYTIPKVVSSDEDGEPSPVGTPSLRLPPSLKSSSTTRATTSAAPRNDGNHRGHHPPILLDEESVPSLPEAPSPYSPPPASLISENGNHPSNASPMRTRTNGGRPPVQEVLTLNETFDSMDRSLEQHIARALNRFPSIVKNDDDDDANHHIILAEPFHVDRTSLLPAILMLKKELQDARHGFFLLQQENKAMASEVERLRNQRRDGQSTPNNDHTSLIKEQSILQQRVAELEDHEKQTRTFLEDENRRLQTTIQNFQKRECSLESELRTALASNERVETDRNALAMRLEQLETEVRELRSKNMEPQSNEATQRLRSALEERDTTIQRLKKENTSKGLEIDRLKAVIRETTKKKNDIEATEQSWRKEVFASNAEIDRLKGVLEEANRNFAQDKELLRESIAGLEVEMTQLRLANSELKEKNESLLNDISHRLLESERLTEALNDAQAILANERLKFDELEVCKARLDTEVEQLRKDVDFLQNENIDLQKEIADMNCRESLVENQKHEIASLQDEVARLNSVIESLSQLSASAQGIISEGDIQHQITIENLQGLLVASKIQLDEVNSENSKLRGAIAKSRGSLQDSGSQTESTTVSHEAGSTMLGSQSFLTTTNSVVERLGRIRDAAERAALVHEYRREVTRLVQEHDDEVRRLTEKHDEEIKLILQQARDEVTTRVKEHKKRLQRENELRIADLEKRHEAELKRIQQEYERSAKVAEEVMQAAVEEAALTAKQLDREMKARQKLEDRILDLDRQMGKEGRTNHKEKWLTDTMALIESVQKECNSIFDRTKTIGQAYTNSTKPMRPMEGASLAFENASPLPSSSAPAFSSPSQINSALDETEALVRSLMGDAI